MPEGSYLYCDVSLPVPLDQPFTYSLPDTLRHRVRPGLTGLWQVAVRSSGNLDAQSHYDVFYVRNWSIWLDLYILLQTAPAVLAAKGAR